MFKSVSKLFSFVTNNFTQINSGSLITSRYSSFIPKWPQISDELLLPYNKGFIKTPPHHNNPEVETLLKEKLCNFPPYEQRKHTHGFKNAKSIRDWKKRKVSAHFEPLRTRLLALYRNRLMPKSIKKRAFKELNSLPRDAHWTRVNIFCTMTGRRRGCKTRWGISRIVWRHFADYNKLSGTLNGNYNYRTETERKYLVWPPPSNLTVADYVNRYHANIDDSPKDGLTYSLEKLAISTNDQ